MELSEQTRYTVLMRMSNFTFQLQSGTATDLSIDFHEYCLATFFLNDLSHEADAEMSPLSDGGLEKSNICFHR